jgi:N-acetylglucosaminyl-diphospho-decaprenol L-rhamnosyltransferase
MESAKPSSTCRIAVATVSYGSEEVLPPFLDSVSRSSSERLDVVVVDNKPLDGAISAIAAHAGARYLPMSHNLGYGGALNTAVASLPGEIEWVLLSNPDVVLTVGALDVLVAAGERDPSIASVGPCVLTPQGTVYPSARSIPSLRDGIGHALFANLWEENPWSRSYRRDTDGAPMERDAGWLSGSCVLVRRSAFEQLGGFDTGFFMYFEDVDLGYRFGKAGYRNFYEPNAIVTHTGAHSTRSESVRMIEAHHESARRFLSRKYSGWHLWPLRFVLTVALNVRASALSRRPRHH